MSFLKSAHLWLRSERPERIKVMFVNLRLLLKGLNENKYYSQVDSNSKESSFAMTLEEYFEYFNNHDKVELYKEELDKVESEFNRLSLIPKPAAK